MDCLSERADSRVEMMRGCEGVMGKLQTHWRCLYELSTMKRRAMALRWIKKIIFSVCFITRIISPKSEQINHLEENEHVCVRVCVCSTRFACVCVSGFISVHRCSVCRCVTTPMFVHMSVGVTVNLGVDRRLEGAAGYFCMEGSRSRKHD